MSFWHPTRALPDLNISPSGITRDYIAGESISSNDVVSLHTDGKVYRASSTYPNIVGVALNPASSGEVVRVLVMGVATVIADGAINPGDPVTWSPAVAGRVVKYTGHSHGVSLSTSTGVADVSVSTANVVASISKSTDTLVKEIGTDTGYSTDTAGYIRHTHSKTTTTAVTDISTTPATVVSSISKTTGNFVTGVAVYSSINRVLGVALTGASNAGASIQVLVMPSRI
jgi:hypothetical protein